MFNVEGCGTLLIRCEHFIYALYSNIGYKLSKSRGVSQLLPPESVKTLMELGTYITKETTLQMWFSRERVLSVSYLSPTIDTHGRQGFWNHTILMNINDYLELSQPVRLLAPHFIQLLKNPPRELQPLTIKA